MYYVYIIRNPEGRLYKGSTFDLRRRVAQHNSGKSTYTKRRGPWKLIYYEAFDSKENALAEERFLKSGKGRERVKFILKNDL